MKTFQKNNNGHKKSAERKYKRRSAEEIVYEALQNHFNAVVIGELASEELMQYPLLCQIAYIGSSEAFHDALRRDVDLNVQSQDGSTPLIIAAENGHSGIVQLLLDKGANPTISRKDGVNAFVLAVSSGDKNVFLCLQPYLRMIDINLLNSDGETLLFIAVKRGVIEIMDMLLKTPRINVNHQRPDGYSPLMVAATKGNFHIVQLLLNAGCSVMMENESGETALCLAVANHHYHIMGQLFSEMNSKSRSIFLKKRIQLLTEPKQRFSDVLPFYKNILIPVLLQARLNMQDSIVLFQQHDVFNGLLWCAFRHMQDVKLLQMIFHLSICLMFSDTEDKLVVANLAEKFVQLGGPDLSLEVVTNQHSGCNRELCNTALLPLYTTGETDCGKQWLKDHLVRLFPYIKDFSCGIPKVNYMYDGEESKVKVAYDHFVANVKEIIENSVNLWDQLVAKSLQRIIQCTPKKDDNSNLKNQQIILDRDSSLELIEFNSSNDDIRVKDESNEKKRDSTAKSEGVRRYASVLKHNLPFDEKGSSVAWQSKSNKKLSPSKMENKILQIDSSHFGYLEEMTPNMTWNYLDDSFKSCIFTESDSSPSKGLNYKPINSVIGNVNLRNIILSMRGIKVCRLYTDELCNPQELREQIEFMYNMLAAMKPVVHPENMLLFIVRQYKDSRDVEFGRHQDTILRKPFSNVTATSRNRQHSKIFERYKTAKSIDSETFQRTISVGKLRLKGPIGLLSWWNSPVKILKDFDVDIPDKSLVVPAIKYCLASIMAEYTASKFKKQYNPENSPKKFTRSKFRLFCLEESEMLTLAEMVADTERLSFLVKLTKDSMWFQRYFNLSFVLSSMLEKMPGTTSALLFSLHPYYTLKFGSFGTYMGVFSNGLPVVVRHMDSSMFESKVECAMHLRNIRYHQKDHPHLNSALEAVFCQSNMSIYILSEVCEYNLSEYLHKYGKEERFLSEQARNLVLQLIQAMHYLHKQLPAIIHGNLRPSNILITEKTCLKIADFYFNNITSHSYGILKNPDSDYLLSNLSWRPQELVNATTDQDARQCYSKSSDVQVIGMLLCYIFNVGRHPFGHSDLKCQKNISMGLYNLEDDPEDPECRDLIREMLKFNPCRRIKLAKVFLHPYFWSRNQRFQFLLRLQKNIHIITRRPHFIHEILLNHCIEARNWMSHINEDLLKFIEKKSAYKNSYLDILCFATDLNSQFKKLPENMKSSIRSPSEYFLCTFPYFFMFLYEVLRKYTVLQRKMGIQNYFYVI